MISDTHTPYGDTGTRAPVAAAAVAGAAGVVEAAEAAGTAEEEEEEEEATAGVAAAAATGDTELAAAAAVRSFVCLVKKLAMLLEPSFALAFCNALAFAFFSRAPNATLASVEDSEPAATAAAAHRP